ncbi:leucine-rich repeat domain-containing protein [Sutcliffiella horikoshii]|uniref:leucine-rich repeat domain-containing protein n=1 Tax=Sutcliffiella horikoshii TaxID=79883 RepID=UPI001F2E9874|nr:leucine-rich repeat domain-containing protein [Sutcliffiella horikoshii]MCG1021384.1 DUF11 domain-containing protein [Sutcliffiella horikoshii]
MKRSFRKLIHVFVVVTLVLSLFSPAIAKAETVTQEPPKTFVSITNAVEKEEGIEISFQTSTITEIAPESFMLEKNGVEQSISPVLIAEDIGEEFTNRTYTYLDSSPHLDVDTIIYALSVMKNEEIIMSKPFTLPLISKETTADASSEDELVTEEATKTEAETETENEIEPQTSPNSVENSTETDQQLNEEESTVENTESSIDDEEVVTVPDPNLKNALKDYLGLSRDEIYKSDMESLTVFSAVDRDIKDLQGLEWAINLEELSIFYNQITDVSPLEGLTKLKYLDIEVNNIQDITPLSNLTNLETLWISSNPIESIKSLETLKSLDTLYIHNTPVNSIEVLLQLDALSNVTLYNMINLDISKGSVSKMIINELVNKGVSVELGEQGEYIWIYTDRVTDSSIIISYEYSGQETVEAYQIYLDGKLISTTKETSFIFSDLTPETGYEITVTALDSEEEEIVSSTSFEETRMTPTGAEIKFRDSALEQAVKDHLGITDRPVVTSDMNYLWYLDASHLNIVNLAGLEQANNLQELNLVGNNIVDLSPLQDLKNVMHLYLRDNNIEDISSLSDKNISWLDISGNPILDISPLLSMQNLYYVNVADLHELTFAENSLELSVVLELRDRGVEVNTETHYESNLDVWAHVTDNTITLQWDYYGNKDLVHYYEIYMNGQIVETTGDNSLFIDNLEADTEYEIQIIAYNEEGNELDYIYINCWTAMPPSGELVIFEDPNLEEVVRAELRVINRDIYESDMENLEYLNIYDQGISSLVGLEKAINLRYLGAGYNSIEDITPLSNLSNLYDVSLYSNYIKDIRPLLSMPNLGYVDIDDNPIDYYKGSQSYDVIEELERNGVVVYYADQDTYKPIDIKLYQKHESAIYFEWWYNSSMLDHYKLYVDEEFVAQRESYYSGWFDLENLQPETEYVFTVKAFDSKGELLTEGTYHVTTDSIPSGEIVQIGDANLHQAIKNHLMVHHRELYVSDMNKIKELWAAYYEIENLNGIELASNMESLDLVANLINDLTPLSKLENLKDLYLNQNPIDDIEALENHKLTLVNLSLSYTDISNIDVLLTLENLQWVSLINTYNLDISEGSQAWNVIQELKNRGVYVDYGTYDEFWLDLYLEVVTNNSIRFSWDVSGNLEAARYNIYVNGELYDSVSGQTSYLLEGLTEGEEYEIEVEALDEESNYLDSDRIWVVPYYDGGEGEGDLVEIQDPNLEEKIRSVLNIYHRDLTTGDMAEVEMLHAGHLGIQSLEGLQHAVNLAYLDVRYNEITDVTPLKDLTSLISLELWGNSSITDISALENLTNLTYLDLDDTAVEDIRPLKEMDDLEILYMSNTSVTDISVLLELDSLRSVYMSGIPADFKEGSKAYDVVVLLQENGVHVYYDHQEEHRSFTVVPYLITHDSIALEWWATNVDPDEIESIELAVNFGEPMVFGPSQSSYVLEGLEADTHYSVDVTWHTTDGSYMVSLELWTQVEPTEPTFWMDLFTEEVTADSISLYWDIYGDLSVDRYEILVDGDYAGTTLDNHYYIDGLISGIEYEIQVIAYDNNGNVLDSSTIYVTPFGNDDGEGEGDPITIEDENLEQAIRDVLGIHQRDLTTGDMLGLEYLNAPGYNITSLEGMQYASNLIHLNVAHNNITDITQLKDLTKLTNLTLWNNKISDISSLENMTNLTYLDLDTNNISDITPMENMLGLEILWLKDNPITEISLLVKFESLQNLYMTGISVDFSEGTEGYRVVKTLLERGVNVHYDNDGELTEFHAYLPQVTDSEIALEWWTNLDAEHIDRFEVKVDNDEPHIVSSEASEYRLTGLQSGTTYQVEISMFTTNGAQYISYLEVTTLQPAGSYNDVKFVAKDSESLTGIQGLYYSITGIDANTANEFRYGYTNPNGTLRDYNNPSGILSLPVGTYEVILYGHRDYVEEIFEITIKKDTDYVTKPIELQLEKIQVETADVEVKVTDQAGNPITKLEYISFYSSKMVSQFGYQYGYYTDWGLTSKDGVYSLGSLAISDDYNLNLQATNYKIHDQYKITLVGGANTLEVELSEGAKVTAKIVDGNNNPLLGASYYAYGNTSYAYGQTKSEGDLTLAGISVENMTLDISMPGYQTKQLSIKAEDFEGETLNLGNIIMTPEQYVHGKVLNEKGEPVRQAYVYLYEENARWSSYWSRTDANGYFKVRNVEAGKSYTLKTEAYNQPQAVKEVTASTEEYTIILEKPATGSFVAEGNGISTNKQTVTAGSQVEYRINYKNNGNAAVQNVEIDFTLPEGVSLIEESILPSDREGSSINKTTVTVAEVGPGKAGTVSFKATVDANFQAGSFVTTAGITAGVDRTTLSTTTNVYFVTLSAPEATASSTVKVYGAAKAGSEVEIYDGNTLIGKTTAQGRWWYADVQLRTEAGVDSEHTLTARVKNGEQTAYSSPVKVKYIPAIPAVTDVTIDAGWNQDIKLNPYTGVATFAIVEFTPIDVEIAFDMDIEEGKILFLGEEYPLEKSGDVYKTHIEGTWSSYGEQMFELEYKVGENTIRLPLMEVIVLIDPSGYVFEGSMDYRLPGVTAEVFERDKQNDQLWKPWNAAFFGGQVNPQITDEDGRYGWDVPEGFWMVEWTKEGYETYQSRIVEVPPAETELNVPMVRNYDPVLEAITTGGSTQDVELDSSVTVEFDRLMNQANIQDFIKVYKTEDNSEVEGAFTLEGYNGYRETAPNSGYFEEDESIKLSKIFVWTPTNNLEAETEYRVEVSGLLSDYAGKQLGDAQTYLFETVAAEEEPGDGNEEPGDGNEEPGDGNEEPGDGNEEPGDGNEEPGDGNEEPGDRNEEPGDGNEEPGDGNEEPGDGNEEPGDGNEEPGDGNEEPGDGNEEPGDGNEEPGDNNEQPGNTPGKQPSDKDKTPAKDKDKNKGDKNVKKEEKKEQKGSKLPNTATPLYNYLILGAILTAAGGIFLLANRRRKA